MGFKYKNNHFNIKIPINWLFNHIIEMVNQFIVTILNMCYFTNIVVYWDISWDISWKYHGIK